MSYSKQMKKMSLIYILDILRKHTDEDHKLNQNEILSILKSEYDLSFDRKAVRSNLEALINEGYPIEYEVTKRGGKKADSGECEENEIWSDFYYQHEFTQGELRLLIDSLLFSNHISYNQCRDLIEKLEGLSSKYFHSRIKHIYTMDDIPPHNMQIFLNIDSLDEAISKKKRVKFSYGKYGPDGELIPQEDKKGNIREYIMNPYQMAASDGRYYLICNREGYKNMSFYRVDLMRDVEILKASATPFDKLPINAGRRLKLDDYIKKHIYMYSTDVASIKFRVNKDLISDVIDRFGMDINVYDETDEHYYIKVQAAELGVKQFAKSYAPGVVVISPKKIVDELKEDLKVLCREYGI